MSKRDHVVPVEWLARIDGRDHPCAVNHYPDALRTRAVVTLTAGPRAGETVVLPVSDLRPDFSSLDEPGGGDPDDVPGQGRFPWA